MKQKTDIPTATPIMEWQAPRELQYERTKRWYVCIGVFWLLCVLYAIVSFSWLFTILLVVIAAIYAKTHRNPPAMHRMRIWRDGCAIDDKFVSWGDCSGFWILKGTNYYELNIETKNAFAPNIKIQTGSKDPYEIQEMIAQRIPPLTNRREKILDAIIRICKL